MESLATIYEGEFPQWTLWGVTIDPPQVLGEGLSEVVAVAVKKAVSEITDLMQGDGLQVGGNLIKI